MTTIMFKRGDICLVGDIILTALEPLGESRQVVFFCKDKSGNKYRVPKSEVLLRGKRVESKPKKDKKKRRKCA